VTACVLRIWSWCFTVSDVGTWLYSILTFFAILYTMWWNRRSQSAVVEPAVEPTEMYVDPNPKNPPETSLRLVNFGGGRATDLTVYFPDFDPPPEMASWAIPRFLAQWSDSRSSQKEIIVKWPGGIPREGRIVISYRTILDRKRTVVRGFRLRNDGQTYSLWDHEPRTPGSLRWPCVRVMRQRERRGGGS
jgi:hypothetical protein